MESVMMVSDHTMMQNDSMKTVTEGVMTQSSGTMTHSDGTLTDHSEAYESESECGSQCLFPEYCCVQHSGKQNPPEEQKQEGESGLSDGQFVEPLEQPGQFEQCKLTIFQRIPRIDFSRLKTPFVGSWSDREDGELHNTKEDTSTPEKGCSDHSTTASLCGSNSTPRSVSPRFIAALGSTWTEDSACAVCGLELGKRKLRPRHHCRICWRSVCSNCSPSSVQLVGEKVLQRVCNPCVLNVQGGPVLRERLDNLSSQLCIIGNSGSPLDEKADTLEDAVRKCESTLPGLDCESDNHRRTKEELEEVKTMCAAAETHATEAEIQLKQLREELRVLKAELQQALVHHEHSQIERACKRSQSRVWQQDPADCIDGLLF